MSDLARSVIETIPERLSGLTDPSAPDEWSAIAARLGDGDGLESALEAGLHSDDLRGLIVESVGDRVARSEHEAIARILASSTVSSLGLLFERMLRVTDKLDVITTNYDRLIEVHAARASISIDSMYYGHTVGRFDPQRSRDELWDIKAIPGRTRRTQRAVQRPHVSLSKPHGSLDWFRYGDTNYRTDLPLPGARRIIAPGGDKYRLGYETPFDIQRERANDAIDNATGLLLIGYGFNDEHLQTHLRNRFPVIPSVIISRTLTNSAKDYLDTNVQSIGIQADGDRDGCLIRQGDSTLRLDLNLWDFDVVMKEVF
jgi:hypothetical protein